MRIKLEENLSRHLKPTLEQVEHDVSTVAEEGLLGKSDTEVGTKANTERRMLFTLDIEFADIRKHPPGTHAGLVLFRPHALGPLQVNRFVAEFIHGVNLEDLFGCVVIAEPHRIRVRRPPEST